MAPTGPDRIYDVVVIGTGVAGALAAYHLKRAGLDVLMLEAGATLPEYETRRALRRRYVASFSKAPTSPYVGFVAPQPNAEDSPLIPPDGRDYYIQDYTLPTDPKKATTKDKLFQSYYQRTLGGSMAHWQGIAIRMVPADFTLDSEGKVPGAVDWPIEYDDLEPFYHEAEHQIGVAGSEEMDQLLGVRRPSGGFPMTPGPLSYVDKIFRSKLHGKTFNGQTIAVTATPQARITEESYARQEGRKICEGYGTCIPMCPTRAKYESLFHIEKAIDLGVDIRTKAIVTKLELASQESGRISRAIYKQWNDDVHSVLGKLFILATNGIESPKLLLLSTQPGAPYGLANSSRTVGCYLMDHPLKASYAIVKEPVYPHRGPPATSAIETFRDGPFRRKYAAFRTTIRNDGWSFANSAPRGRDPTKLSQSRGTLLEFVGQKGIFGAELQRELISHTLRQILLYSACEMLPNESNRVTIDTASIAV